ncbi:MAG: metalloregulator ArsR/SmtB family transcription factor [Deltaproteobacteria bacterium]|nr:metalloregulator ArsR/SmtB family transcription factor [Deltaproteobacteria bacterium]
MKQAASFFKVLADEARLKMLWLLFNQKELCVCDFMAVLEITQSKASRHLRTLYKAGLVTDRRAGQWGYYSLRPAEDFLTRECLETLRTAFTSNAEAVGLLKKLAVWLEKKSEAGCR